MLGDWKSDSFCGLINSDFGGLDPKRKQAMLQFCPRHIGCPLVSKDGVVHGMAIRKGAYLPSTGGYAGSCVTFLPASKIKQVLDRLAKGDANPPDDIKNGFQIAVYQVSGTLVYFQSWLPSRSLIKDELTGVALAFGTGNRWFNCYDLTISKIDGKQVKTLDDLKALEKSEEVIGLDLMNREIKINTKGAGFKFVETLKGK